MSARARNVLLLLGLAVALAQAWLPAAAANRQAHLPGVLFSRQLLAAPYLKVGDVVELSGDPSGANPRRFRIAGTYEPMPDSIPPHRRAARGPAPPADLLRLTGDSNDPPGRRLALGDQRQAPPSGRRRSVRAGPVGARAHHQRAVQPRRRGRTVMLCRARAASTWPSPAVTITTGARLSPRADGAARRTSGARWWGTLRVIGLTRARVLAQMLQKAPIIAGAGAAFGVGLAALTEGAFNALLPVALRHVAGLRPDHPVDRVAIASRWPAPL